jgi:hypothetical protein
MGRATAGWEAGHAHLKSETFEEEEDLTFHCYCMYRKLGFKKKILVIILLRKSLQATLVKASTILLK